MSGKSFFSKSIAFLLLIVLLAIPAVHVQPVQAAGVVMSCSQYALDTAIGTGGTVLFGVDCSSLPVVITSTITITGNTTIKANGHRVEITGVNARRVFVVNAGATLELDGLTITGGSSSGQVGGAINNNGTLVIKNSTFTNSNSLGGNGGAIYNNAGIVEVTNSTFSGNVTHGTGGSGLGGAIYNYNGNLTITNSTISGNGAQSNGGGGIYARGKSGSVTVVRNTILFNNTGNNCGVNSTTITDGGGNISFNSTYTDTTCGTGFLNQDPQLYPLGEYDSLMAMYALHTESPAINRATANCPAYDQRGVQRSAPNCDSGAFEYRYSTTTNVTVPTYDPQNPPIYGDTITLRAAVTPAEVSGMVDFYTGSMKIGSGLVMGGVATYTTTFLAAGNHTISAEYAGDTAYEVSKDVMEPALTIGKAPLRITANNDARLYGSPNPAFAFMVEGFRNGESSSVFSVWPVCTSEATETSPVGPYQINCSGGQAQNYTFTYYPGQLNVTGHLLTVTPENIDRPYGTDNPVFEFDITGFQAGDDKSVLNTLPTCTTAIVTTRNTPVRALPYEIVCSGGQDNVYEFTYKTAGLTITPVTVTVTADDKTRVYGAEDPAFTYQMNGFVPGESELVLAQAPICVSTADSASPVGDTYTIGCIGAAAQNYIFQYVPGHLTITKRALTIAANNLSRQYGSANPELTVTYTGFANNETAAVFTNPLSCQTTANLTSTVAGSPYPITCSGATAANYEISFQPAGMTVTRAPLTVKADNKTKRYLEENPLLTYTISGFVNNETAESVVTGTPKVITNATKASHGGSYPILIMNDTLSADNYTFEFEGGVLTIFEFQIFLPIVTR